MRSERMAFIVKTIVSKARYLVLTLLCLVSCYYKGQTEAVLYLDGRLDVSAVSSQINGPLVLVISDTFDIDLLQQSGEDHVLGLYALDASEEYYHCELEPKIFSAGMEIYVFAIIDNGNDNNPVPQVGDFIGFYIDRNSYQPGLLLKKDGNHGVDININRVYRDISAQVVFAVDKGKYSYGPEFNTLTTAQNIVLIHEDGLHTSMTSSGTMDVQIDPDYIVGMTSDQPPLFDQTGSTRPKPYPGRQLEIVPALRVNIAVDGSGALSGNYYLLAVIDENGDGELDPVNDYIGYYQETYNYTGGLPSIGGITIPTGTYYIPKAVTLTTGVNVDTANDNEPYWIKYDYSDAVAVP